jgi:RimJ/RimL family protein N-acetyltransferase
MDIRVKAGKMKANPIPTDTILKTNRLVLRCPRLDDAAHILAVVTSPQFPEQLPLKEMSELSQIEGWLTRLQEAWAAGRAYSWIAEEAHIGSLVGQVTLSLKEAPHLWALAYWTHPGQWGKGYTTEAARRVLAFGFDQLGAQTIWAAAGQWNTGSCRVLEKLGMRYLGDNPAGYFSQGEPIPTREYEIVKEEFS